MSKIIYLIIILFLCSCSSSSYLPFSPQEKYGKLPTKKARKIAEGLCKTWNQYLSGDIYGFRLFSLDENGKKLKEIDSCWGYYGSESIEEIIEECKSTIDYQLEKKIEIV